MMSAKSKAANDASHTIIASIRLQYGNEPSVPKSSARSGETLFDRVAPCRSEQTAHPKPVSIQSGPIGELRAKARLGIEEPYERGMGEAYL